MTKIHTKTAEPAGLIKPCFKGSLSSSEKETSGYRKAY
jgi:hypothetical protein